MKSPRCVPSIRILAATLERLDIFKPMLISGAHADGKNRPDRKDGESEGSRFPGPAQRRRISRNRSPPARPVQSDSYLSLALDCPSFASPMQCNLVQLKGGYALRWPSQGTSAEEAKLAKSCYRKRATARRTLAQMNGPGICKTNSRTGLEGH
jgi:hypothetical protein